MLVLGVSGLGLVQVYVWADHDWFGCVFHPGTEGFHEAWTWGTEMLIYLFIPLACLVLNVLVIREVKRHSVKSAPQGHTKTITLLCVSFYFIFKSATQGHTTLTITHFCVSFYFLFTLLLATIVYAIQQFVPQGDSLLPLEQ